MSALDKIAELHRAVDTGMRYDECAECAEPWPCPTRRLCDEAAAEDAKCDETWGEGGWVYHPNCGQERLDSRHAVEFHDGTTRWEGKA